MMKRILLLLLLLTPFLSNGQTLVGFGGNQGDDTAYTPNAIRVDLNVRFPLYATVGTDTALMAYDLYGRGYKITKSTISTWVSGGGGGLQWSDTTTTPGLATQFDIIRYPQWDTAFSRYLSSAAYTGTVLNLTLHSGQIVSAALDTTLNGVTTWKRTKKIVDSLSALIAASATGWETMLDQNQQQGQGHSIDVNQFGLSFIEAGTFTIEGVSAYSGENLIYVDGSTGQTTIGTAGANETYVDVIDQNEEILINNPDGGTYFNISGSSTPGAVITLQGVNGLAAWALPTPTDSSVFATNYRVDTAKTAIRATLATKADKGAVGSSGLTMTGVRLLGKSTSGSGTIEEIQIASPGLQLSSSTLTNTGVTSITGGNGVSTDGNTSAVTVIENHFAPNSTTGPYLIIESNRGEFLYNTDGSAWGIDDPRGLPMPNGWSVYVVNISPITFTITPVAGSIMDDISLDIPSFTMVHIVSNGTDYFCNANFPKIYTASSPLDITSNNITIGNAGADGSTKGAATFTANDFNATTGVISLDYTNGQAASGSTKGFLTSTDWTTFNNKVSTTRTISTTSPLSGGGDLSANRTLSIADAAADGSTKGAAAFNATYFDATSGIVNVDLTNGAASGSQGGYVTTGTQTIAGAKTFSSTITGDISGNSGTVTTINGKISNGANVTITGSGTTVDPYVISASGGGSSTGVIYYDSYWRLRAQAATLATTDSIAWINHPVYGGRYRRIGTTGVFSSNDSIGYEIQGTNYAWRRQDADGKFNLGWYLSVAGDTAGTNNIKNRIQQGITKGAARGFKYFYFPSNYTMAAGNIVLDGMPCGFHLDGNGVTLVIAKGSVGAGNSGADSTAIFNLANWDQCKEAIYIENFNFVGDSANLTFSNNKYGIYTASSLQSHIIIQNNSFTGFNSNAIRMHVCGQSTGTTNPHQFNTYGNNIINNAFDHPLMQRNNENTTANPMDNSSTALAEQYAIYSDCGEIYTRISYNLLSGYRGFLRSLSGNGVFSYNSAVNMGLNQRGICYGAQYCYIAAVYVTGVSGVAGASGKWQCSFNQMNHDRCGTMFYFNQATNTDVGSFGPIIDGNMLLANNYDSAAVSTIKAPSIIVLNYESAKITNNQLLNSVYTSSTDSMALPGIGLGDVQLIDCNNALVQGNGFDGRYFLEVRGNSYNIYVGANLLPTTASTTSRSYRQYYSTINSVALPTNTGRFIFLNNLPDKSTDYSGSSGDESGYQLTAGQKYFNTTNNSYKIWNGSAWVGYSVAVGDITGLGTGVATWLATPSSNNLAAAISDETGTGSAMFGTNPTASGMTFADATNIVLNTSTGTKIGTSTSQKLGFYNATPVVQQTGNLVTALGNLGLVSSGTVTSANVSDLGSSTVTFANKRITERFGNTTSSATPTINTDNVDHYLLTAQAADITSFTTNLSGTPTEGQILQISITGTATRAIAWGSSFESSTVSLPTTTVGTARLDVWLQWNTATSKWRCGGVW